jgi:adenine-specific DNA-methyltransferase
MAELVWEGKYRDGKRVAPVRLALPFQTVETVNESALDRKRTLDLFASGKASEWRNRLIWGDKKYVLPSLLPEFAGKVNLIYIDPPFDTGADFSFSTEIPDADEVLLKEPSIIEQKAYRDTWGRGLDSYVQWFYETAVLLRELLADDGSIYVHLDWHVSHYAKVILDEVFGPKGFRNEVVWQRTGAHNDPRRYGNIADVIEFYTRSEEYAWNVQYTKYSDEYVAERFRSVEPKTGRRFWLNTMTAAGQGEPRLFRGEKRAPPKGTHWRFAQEKINELVREGKIVFTDSGMPYVKQYLDESKGRPLQSVWTDVPMSKSGSERTGYATQKPEALLERIVNTSSKEGDLVLDCFCGSGTTAAAAEKLGRRWIAADLGRFAIHTTRKRLLATPGLKPFVVQNLGKYERQAWMAAEFAKPEDRAATEAAYRSFIIDLYRAEPLSGNAWLHGVKGGRMVHIGAVDSPITIADVKTISREVWRASGAKGEGTQTAAVDVLGWEFAFELNETAKQIAAESRVDVKFRRIPREVLEKAAVDQGDIQAKDFFELRALSTKLTKSKRVVTIELTDFMLPSEDLPEDVARAVKHWSQWIDYWAVDWNYRNDAFHNQWQSFRTREDGELKLKAESDSYREPGKYTVVVKVIDILGNDTTKSIDVEVK